MLRLVGFALLFALPNALAAEGPFSAACTDPSDDVAFDDGRVQHDDGWIDIRGLTSALEEGIVIVRVQMGDTPWRYDASYALTADTRGDDDPDVLYRNDGGGSVNGEPVYWDAYPQAEGRELVYRMHGPATSAEDLAGPKWELQVSATSYSGSEFVSDRLSCSGTAAEQAVPGPPVWGILGALLVLAALVRR